MGVGEGEGIAISSEVFFNIYVLNIFSTYCHFKRLGTLGLRPFIITGFLILNKDSGGNPILVSTTADVCDLKVISFGQLFLHESGILQAGSRYLQF